MGIVINTENMYSHYIYFFDSLTFFLFFFLTWINRLFLPLGFYVRTFSVNLSCSILCKCSFHLTYFLFFNFVENGTYPYSVRFLFSYICIRFLPGMLYSRIYSLWIHPLIYTQYIFSFYFISIYCKRRNLK